MGKVCVSIAGSTFAEMSQRADAMLRNDRFLEFRLDYLNNPLSALPKFKHFLEERSDAVVIATCRRTEGGGRFVGEVREQLEVLEKAALSGFHIVDLEIESAERLKEAEIDRLRSRGAALLLSYHDFATTKDLDTALDRILPFAPDFIKIVSTAKSLTDNVRMMRLLELHSDRVNLIGICMGEAGVISRVLGPRSGSAFTFAAASLGEETAPGQITSRTLSEVYRIQQLDRATRVYGVAGAPVRHSLSPLMLNAAFRRETFNGVFLPLETKKLSDLLHLMREVPLHGLAVTMPLKEEILPHLAKTDAISTRVGACNTIVRATDGKLYGFNTDVGAILRPLERRLSLKGARVLVLGAGGAARAAVFGMADKGAEVFILNRSPETAHQLARQAKAKTIKRDQVAKSKFDVILNATPAGMHDIKLQSILEPEELNARLVFDLVYNPVDTPLIRMAREKNIPVITGVEMFVQQGARQFEIWTGKPAPEEEMRRVVLHALSQRSGAAAANA
jgi:3-dehydroquinate dehydratase/shikimate dehydrogenase